MFRFDFEPPFMLRNECSQKNENYDDQESQQNSKTARKPAELFAKQVSRRAINPNPGNCPGNICYQKKTPRHAIHTREHAGYAANHRKKTRKENDFSTVSQEKILSYLYS